MPGSRQKQRQRSAGEVVLGVLEERPEVTVAEIAAAAGLGRSTVSRALASLEGAGKVRRREGGRDGARRVADRWRRRSRQRAANSGRAADGRLRPGQLDGLVLAYVRKHGKRESLGPTKVAAGLGRSSGAVANCLKRLASTGRVRQTSERPLRYQHAGSG